MNITIEEVTQQVIISGGDETTTVNISEEVVNVVQVGTQGPDGARGKSAYEVWLDEGNTGTETDFINFLAAGGDAAVLSVNAQIGEVVLDKTDVGLSNVDNTSDAAKPISTATQTALNAKASSTHTHTSSQVTDFDAEVDNNATVAANTAARHTHANQATLDATTASFTTAKDTKLTSISTGATANSSDATLLSRANHTGAQAISTVTGLQTALDAKQASGDYATNTALTTGLSGKASTSHAHVITDTTGLQAALDSKAAVSHTHTASQVTDFDTEVSNNVDVAANTAARHTHSNSTVLNNTTASFTTTDETKLDGIATGATANSSDATLLARANHTGAQAQSTVTNLVSDLAAKAPLAAPVFTGAPTIADYTNAPHTHADATNGGQLVIGTSTTGTLAVSRGGSGRATGTTAYGLVAVGTTPTGAQQTIAPGTSGQLLKSNGTAALGAFTTITQDDIGSGTTNKVYTATEQTKLAGVATGATANSTDATLLARANHTGTQTASTISDFSTAADARITAANKKTDSMATNKLLGRGTAATGAIEEITLGTNLSLTGTTLNATGGGSSPTTTKGDLAGYDTASTRIPVGTDGQILTADSTQALGLKWSTATGGGNAQTANPLSQFAATTSAQLAGVLTDETGTGAAVFAGSPVLTGTPTAPTASLANNSTQLATTAYVDASIVQYKDENYYKNTGTTSYERWYQAGRVSGVAATTASYSINILRAIPVVWGKTSTIDRIGFNVTVLAASGTGRVGVYSNTSNTNLYPSALILDAGEVSTNTTGLKSATVSQSLTAGNLYWFVVNLGVAAPTLGALSVGSIGSLLGTDNTGIGAMGTFIQVASTYGALPGTFPASATISTGGAPIITYRVA